jgi:ABC-type branched-subunit amino acid transport system ATPase component
VSDVSFALERHVVTGLIGPNGAGKTTLFNLITGFVKPDKGNVVFMGRSLAGTSPHRVVGLGIARTFQEVRLCGRMCAIDNVLLGFQRQPGENLLTLFVRWSVADTFERRYEAEAREYLDFVGLGTHARSLADSLSYGQQKRLSIARMLATGADLLCLDEPAAGLDPGGIEAMAGLLERLLQAGKTVLLVEHNLQIVRDLCQRTLFMDAGQLVLDGPTDAVLKDSRVAEGYLGI